MNFKILGTGSYVPDNVITNDDLSKIVETSDEWISKRVGIKERHISVTDTTLDMGANAAAEALKDSVKDKAIQRERKRLQNEQEPWKNVL